jgi:hypothetical protein
MTCDIINDCYSVCQFQCPFLVTKGDNRSGTEVLHKFESLLADMKFTNRLTIMAPSVTVIYLYRKPEDYVEESVLDTKFVSDFSLQLSFDFFFFCDDKC